MRIQLQRDMYCGWDSGGSTTTKPPKKLTIANIDKLVGMTTGIISNGWVCNKATEYPDNYDMLFNFIPGGSTMDVKIIRNGQYRSGNGSDNYIIEIRQLIKDPNSPHAYYQSKPSAYGIDDSILGHPHRLTQWLHGKLIEKKLETEALIWKNKPWYEKLLISIKDFLPKNVNPKMAPKIYPKHYMKPKKAGA